jgi:hypothetical protein
MEGGYNRRFAARILNIAAHIMRNVKTKSDKKETFSHKLKSALKLKVGFSKIYSVL